MIYHKHLNANVFSIRFVPSTLQVVATYCLGYGVPLLIVLVTSVVSVLTESHYYVRQYLDDEGNVDQMLCWLDVDPIIWSFIIPVSLMILFNLGVVIMIVNVAYHSASHHR